MAPPRSYITPAAAKGIKQAVRRGFATSLAIADPVRELTVYGKRPGAPGLAIVIVGEFRVRQPSLQPLSGGDDGVTVVQIPGTISRFTPEESNGVGGERLQALDRFELPESGTCVIQSVNPDRFGIETATFILEQGGS